MTNKHHKSYQKLTKQLREEASEAKTCFTQHTFQSLVFSSAVLSFIFNSIRDNPIVSLAVLPVTILLIIMAWTGIYKYTSASRSYGL
jgi:hypothetical protein